MRHLLTQALEPDFTLSESGFRPWASANFVGARHIFECMPTKSAPAETPTGLEKRLSTMDWRLAGHIVADLGVSKGSNNVEPALLRIEILTVED